MSVIGKVMPMMGVSAREEAFMELIIRLIDLDTRSAAGNAPAAVVQQVCNWPAPKTKSPHFNAASQVTIRDGSRANMEQLHDVLGLGDKRISVLSDNTSLGRDADGLRGQGTEDSAVPSLALPQRLTAEDKGGARGGEGKEEENGQEVQQDGAEGEEEGDKGEGEDGKVRERIEARS
jgi:hypothetical protein